MDFYSVDVSGAGNVVTDSFYRENDLESARKRIAEIIDLPPAKFTLVTLNGRNFSPKVNYPEAVEVWNLQSKRMVTRNKDEVHFT